MGPGIVQRGAVLPEKPLCRLLTAISNGFSGAGPKHGTMALLQGVHRGIRIIYMPGTIAGYCLCHGIASVYTGKYDGATGKTL